LKDIFPVAKSLMRGVGALASGQSVPAIHQFFRELREEGCEGGDARDFARGKLALIMDQMMLMLADETVTMLDGAFARLADLMRLLESVDPSPHAAEFLGRVSRCYIFGFDAECAIMCRAVIESELHAEVSNDDCSSWIPPKERGGFTLNDRIYVAKKMGKLREEIAYSLEEVQRRGNSVVHRNLNLTFSTIDTIKKTLAVIRELHGG
jgi:hypothetical protein